MGSLVVILLKKLKHYVNVLSKKKKSLKISNANLQNSALLKETAILKSDCSKKLST